MNKYDAIDPEFLSEKTEDGLDFVKYLTYITSLESRLPQMVAQCTQGGRLDEELLRQTLEGIKCHYGIEQLVVKVMVRLVKEAYGIDMQPLLDLADERYPMGQHLTLLSIAVQHRMSAHELAALVKTLEEALTKSRETVEHQWTAPQGPATAKAKGRGPASIKASEHSEGSENSEGSEEDPEATPVTEEDMEEFYSEKAREAVKACEKELMGTLSIIIPDKGHRRRFIRSIPSPNSMDELLNQLFRPACEREIMDVDAAKGLKWSDYIYDLTDFTTPIQEKQFDSRLRDFFNEMIAKRKKK